MSHIKFKQQKNLENHKTLFPAPLYPYTNYLVFAFILFILIVMAMLQPGMTRQIVAVPLWVLIVYALYRISEMKKIKNNK
jgi:L-asparagine transporter-like permease